MAHKKNHSLHVGPNMTPMVDIVMCILIFFMLGSSFAVTDLFLTSSMPAIDKVGLGTDKGTSKLPAVQSKIEMQQIGGGTKVFLFGQMREGIDDPDTNSDKRRVISAMLDENRKKMSEDVQIIIVPKADVPWQHVITLYDMCMNARFKNVAFASPK